MMCNFKQSTESGRLKTHPDKSKILSNQSTNRRNKCRSTTLKLRSYLRVRVRSIWQTITFQQQETAEIKNRIRAAWASLYRYKQELTSRSYFLPHRLRLFNMVITPTMSHDFGNWTLSKEHERMIRSTQRKVLRLIVQTEKIQKENSAQQERRRRRRQKKQTTEAQTKKLRRVAVQTEIATKTATFPSRKTLMKRLRRLN